MSKIIKSKLSRRFFIQKSVVGLTAGIGAIYGKSNIQKPQTFSTPKSENDNNWSAIRSHFILNDDVTYMNNASLGMPPIEVVDSVNKGYEGISKDPLHGKHELQENIKSNVMPTLAKVFGVKTDELILTRNASEALFLQTSGLNLTEGDEVIISSQEHPAALKPWMHRKEKDGIKVKPIFIPSPLISENDVVKRLSNAITSKTKAISFCHVTRGGHKYPVKKISHMARKKGIITLVDGAQAVGQFPIDINDLDCDAYSASLHKWILAPSGTGFLYVRENSKSYFSSPFDPDASSIQSLFTPPGTKDLPVRASIGSALYFINKIGIKNIERRCRSLSNYLKDGLKKIDGVKLLSGKTPNLSAPGSTIFEKKNLDAIESVALFEKRIKYHIDEHQRDGHNAIRISTHFYNSKEQIDLLLSELAIV